MKLKVKKLHRDAVIPTKAHDTDSGFDLVAVENGIITDKYIEYDTGLAIALPKGYDGKIYPRSSISKYDLTLCNSVGVIDESYRGPIRCRFRILQKEFCEPILYEKGDKIAQLIIEKREDVEVEEVEELDETERGSGGFGSTDKK